jgi:YHS domain-containing protein
MFRLLVIFAGIMVLASGTVRAVTPLGAAKKLVKKVENKKIEQKTCPVMGGKINPKLYYTYKGQKIYVCCQGCISAVKKDPEKYLKKVKKEIEEAKKKELKKSAK